MCRTLPVCFLVVETKLTSSLFVFGMPDGKFAVKKQFHRRTQQNSVDLFVLDFNILSTAQSPRNEQTQYKSTGTLWVPSLCLQ